MSAVGQAQELLSRMTPEEKAQFLRLIAHDLGGAFPGIDSSAECCGGDARIVRTRIPVWVLEQARRLGASNAELLRSYPVLRNEDLSNAWAYAAVHFDEIDVRLRENEAA